MRPHNFQALLEYARTHLNKRRCRTILVALACVVVFGTTYALILPAVTMTPELICDKPEHEHTADCYEQKLVCDNDDPDHEHDDSCYEEVLICGEEEHQHNEDCYAFPEDEENTDDADPEEPADGDGADAEEETDEPDAPDWEADLPDRTGSWAEDVVAVAESQLDNEDLSRYGDWYTESTGTDEDELDTTAPFVAFCLHYAGVDERDFPWEANTGDWFDRLADEGLLGEDIPEPGDLLFYEDEGVRMGIVTGVDVSDEEEYTYTIIESDLNGAVGESEHIHDYRILGCAPLPENPDETGGSTEEPDEPDQPGDNGENNTNSDSDSKDQDQSDADGDKSEEDQTGQDEENKTSEAPAEEPEADTLPAVPKSAISATDADKTLQVSVQMALCTEHNHLGSTLAKPRYQPGDEAQGTITVTTTNAEPAEDDTTVARVYLAFENNTGTTELPGTYEAKSENGHKYTYTVEQIGDSNTYYFEIPRLHPGDTLTIPFAARYLVSTEHGGKASLWCTVTNADEATQEKPEKVKTLIWESDAVELERFPAGEYGDNGKYKFAYNETRNAFTTDPNFSKYYIKSNPLGVAGSFSVVAFDKLYISTHCNGNVLARNVEESKNFGMNQAEDELSYIVNYKNVNSGSAPSTSHVLVVGSENKIGLKNNKLAVNGTEIDSPYNIIQDMDSTENPFIDLDNVKAEITKISEVLAQQPDNGVKIDFSNENNRSLIIDRVGGAHYLNTTLDVIAERSDRELRVRIPESNDCIGSMIINVDCQKYQGKTVKLPNIKLYVNNSEIGFRENKDPKYGAVVWNFINATDVTFDVTLLYGAIVAPGATVITSGNVDGTIIGDNVKIGGESHRTDFTGTLTPTNLDFHFKKQVDGQRPSIYQEFQFALEKWSETSSSWETVETRENLYDDILFAPIEYTLSSDVGTHWYRVRELTDGPEGYQYDSTQYYVKVDVSEVADGALGDTKLTAGYTYYASTSERTDTAAPDNTNLKKVGDKPTDRVFHNTTDDGAYTLPSTGGPGEWTIPSIGILLMAGSLLVVTKQRPQRKEDR